jgi:hypothetical protein
MVHEYLILIIIKNKVMIKILMNLPSPYGNIGSPLKLFHNKIVLIFGSEFIHVKFNVLF